MMKFKICQDIDECRVFWNKLSTKKKLFDMWDFRSCFYDRKDNQPYFIIGYERKKEVGFIPLCFVKSKKQYNYFGGWFPERNSFFLKDKTKIAKFLEHCPENTVTEGIDPAEGRYYSFLEDEYTYYLDLSEYGNSFEGYFSSLSKKKQKNLRRELKKIPPHKIYHNRLKDFDRLVELNIKQYGEDSKFNNKATRSGMNKLANLAHKCGILEMISLEINGRTEAVSMGIACGEWYYSIIGAANNQKIPNLGKLMTVLDIKNAIAKKARFVDFFATASYWKSIWELDREMLLKFVK